MKIGVTSDTHSNRKFLIKALQHFSERNITNVLHCGDLEDDSLLIEFSKFQVWLALGNCDDEMKFTQTSQSIPSLHVKRFHELTFDDKSIALLHGDDKGQFKKAVSEQNYDYIIKGHSHRFEDYSIKRSRILNPGALFRAAIYSIAVLDLSEDTWTKIELN